MNKLIIDAANDKIFFMLIFNNSNYSVSHKNSKINYEKLALLIDEFLQSKELEIKKFLKFMLIEGQVALLV